MLKRIYLLITAVCLLSIGVLAQIPAGYYNTASGKTGNELKAALYEIINDHTAVSYAGLWTAFQQSDKKPNGKVWDMYSDVPGGTPAYEYTFVSDQCGNYSGESSCYNREHSFPKSWFNDATPMYSDMFHLYPTDGYVNGQRGNYPFGEVSSPTWTSTNGSKKGACSYPGYSGTVFEPIDEYKGDFARSYFYMVTRYHNVVQNWSTPMLNGTAYPAFSDWAINLLFEWHNADPVSQKEIDRNNKIYTSYQHNRNPFIDNSEYAQLVWNPNGTNVSVTISENQISVYPNPASDFINVSLHHSGVSTYYVADISGRIVLNGELNHENATGTISLNGVSNGIYFLQVVGQHKSSTIKFVIGK
jgi:endonuclease I